MFQKNISINVHKNQYKDSTMFKLYIETYISMYSLTKLQVYIKGLMYSTKDGTGLK